MNQVHDAPKTNQHQPIVPPSMNASSIWKLTMHVLSICIWRVTASKKFPTKNCESDIYQVMQKNIPPFQDIPNSTTPAQKTWKFIIQPRDMFLVMITKIAKFLWFWIYLLLARSQKTHLGVKLQFNSIGHVNNIPTMQFYTGISRVTQSTS